MMRYSICLPVRNCREYIGYAIASVMRAAIYAYAPSHTKCACTYRTAAHDPLEFINALDVKFMDVELVLSDNYSSDGLYEYISRINHPNVRILRPPAVCTMSSHYEWLLGQTHGEWISIVGSDDGIQPYFFMLCDRLIQEANKHGIAIINGERAYYFWEGCHRGYGGLQMAYSAESRFIIKRADKEFFPTLLSGEGFFSMPQIYAGSIVHRDVIERIKACQNGYFYRSASPDGYACAAIASMKEAYIHSSIPLTWIGSSPKSIGGGVNKQKASELFSLPKDHITCAKELGGDYARIEHIAVTMWMWEPMLQAHALQSQRVKDFYRSKVAMLLMLAAIFRERKRCKLPKELCDEADLHIYQQGHAQLLILMKYLGINPTLVCVLALILRLYYKDFFSRALRKALRILKLMPYPMRATSFYPSVKHSDNPSCHSTNADILESSDITLDIYKTHFASAPIRISRKYYMC